MERYAEYDAFAGAYDRNWGWYAERVLPTLDRIVLDDVAPGSRIVDLCCGTGQLAALLAERGFEVTGIDGSEEMLTLARRNAPRSDFVLADARDFAVAARAPVVVSVFDSLNHVMTIEGLASVFERVAAALEPGGSFVFDLNTDAGFRARWTGSFGLATDVDVVVGSGRYDPGERRAEIDLTIVSSVTGSWERSDLTLVQRAYPESDIVSALHAAGFEGVDVYDAAEDFGSHEVGRAFYHGRLGSIEG